MPRGIKAQVTSDDLSGAKTEINIPPTGDARAEHSRIEVIPEAKAASKIEDEAFMNEFVKIQIEMDDEPNAPLFVYSGHQGEPQYIRRGEPQRIKRKYLYSLIAAKKTQLACSFGKDSSGLEFNRLAGRTNTTHRLTIIEDSTRGREKFVEWMQQPA
jgi:hypothetical protein